MLDISNQIIERAAAGDIDAFEEIYRAASGFVYNVALRMTNNREDAAEVTQDVFMKAYNNLKDFQFRSSLKTWLYRITANTAINHYKKGAKHARGRIEFEPALDYGQQDKDPAVDLIEKEEREKQVSSLLEAVPPEQRACLVLREIEGLSYKEIAEALKININTVRTRLKRARQKLLKF